MKSVIVYSMGFDAGNAVVDALKATDGVQVRQIYTLNRTAIAKFMLNNHDHIPDHIYLSEKIIKEDISKEVPLYFVTMVHDPFSRHIRHAFSFLQPEAVKYTLSNTATAAKYFNSIPSESTTKWFSNEYMAGTGINVYAEPFDQNLGYKIFSVGIHKLLLLSAHLVAEQQTEILSTFLGARVSHILEEAPADTEGMLNYFTGQVISYNANAVATCFWEALYTRHFFSSDQIVAFKQEAEEIWRQIQTLENMTGEEQKSSIRDTLLKNVLSSQVPYLTTAVQTLVSKQGINRSKNSIESILKQLEHAQNNLLLASIRTLFTTDNYAATELGAKWYEFRPDKRISRTLASCMQRTGAISKPLQLLESLDELDDAQTIKYKRLCSLKKMLSQQFNFSKRLKCAYSPNKKRIIYNAAHSLPYHTSGYSIRTHGLVKGVHQWGWDVQVVTRKGYPADAGIRLQEESYKTAIEGITYICDTDADVGQHTTPLHDYIEKSAQYLVTQGKQMRASLIHTASNYVCGMAGVEAARRLGIRSIYEMRGLWHITRCSKEPAYENTEHFALAQKMELQTAIAADYVLAITEELKRWLIDHGVPAKKITVVPNAVDIDQFVVCERDEKYALSLGCADKIVIGYIGSFVQYEGLDILLQSIAILPDDVRKKIILLWVGDGPVLSELLQFANELNISNNILALGRKPFVEIPKLYSLVDICAFPRKGQAICEIISPLKPFEAMAMGKAVIVSDVAPLREIIDHGKTGLIHTKDDPVSLSQSLHQFIDNKDLRIDCGRAARKWVEQTRSWNAISGSVANLYKEILK